jgi:hypothetical protein
VLDAAIGGELSMYLRQAGLDEAFVRYMQEEIDGRSKFELFVLSIPFHDLGKFARSFSKGSAGPGWDVIKPDYSDHEKISGRLIREPPAVYELLAAQGLTDRQIEYIARCAELHFEFGHVRNAAKKTAVGYTLGFIGSVEMDRSIEQVLFERPGFGVEISAYFLVDSLGKLGVRVVPSETSGVEIVTSELATQRGLLPPRNTPPGPEWSSRDGITFSRDELTRLNADPVSGITASPSLAEAVWQLPVNVWVALHALRASLESSEIARPALN